MTPPLDPSTGALLTVIAFLAGVGITAIGPGGIFLTIALLALAHLPPAGVAGTSSAALVVAGVVGTLVYLRWGELRLERNRRLAVILSSSGLLGALIGSWLNAFVSPGGFAVLLGVMAVAAGATILYQEWRGLRAHVHLDPAGWAGWTVLTLLGLAIGTASGLLGVGGPVISVPALVVLGVPIVSAVAVAQAQSLPIAVFATAGYMARDAVQWSWVAAVGVPLLLGVVTGWKVARHVEPRTLKLLLGGALLGIGPYLAL
jgi:uncharacterized membrane protein YfcA